MTRLSSADVAFLLRESRRSPQHVGGLAVFDVPLSYDRVVRLIGARIGLAPRFRQLVRAVPGNIAHPVWIDDPDFDLTYHVRRSALPRPGTDRQLLDFAARIQSRMLARDRPLWEMYLVEGLVGGGCAIVTKTHTAIIGGAGGVDLAQVILDDRAGAGETTGGEAGGDSAAADAGVPGGASAAGGDNGAGRDSAAGGYDVTPIWTPAPPPGSAALVLDAVVGAVRRPAQLTATVRDVVSQVGTADTVRNVSAAAGGIAAAAGLFLGRPAPSPLDVRLSEQRRLAIAQTSLADYRLVSEAFGSTVNDVVLTVVTGALREWLLAHSMPLRPGVTVRALVPVSVAVQARIASEVRAESAAQPDVDEPDGVGTVRPLLVDLPVGEPDQLVRLAQLRYAMAEHRASGRAVGARRLAALRGFAPPTLHALGVRATNGLQRRVYSVVVTNVPGPQRPVYAEGAQLTRTFPFVPLTDGHALSFGLTSYDGQVCFGVTGDWDAVPDAGMIADLLAQSLAELVASSQPGPDGGADLPGGGSDAAPARPEPGATTSGATTSGRDPS